MPLDTPFRLGPFMVDDQGGLMPPIGGDANFTVNWRGCLVSASMRPVGAPEQPDAVELNLHAVLGRVPSSAEATAQQREAVLEALHNVADHAIAPLYFALSVDHRAILHGSEALPIPVTSRALVTQVARFLLGVAPYLDFAGEVGVRPAGRVNTWPG
jgi:hypothetical protein